MHWLILTGTALASAGLVMIIYCLAVVFRIRKKSSDDNELRKNLAPLVKLNLAAVMLALFGVMVALVGILV
ncbi:MAG: hypothetical protein OXF74_00545 [Rhodobacteraceae bacterium]|nr:hypothetical protein [Paracoccaceae bacterium]